MVDEDRELGDICADCGEDIEPGQVGYVLLDNTLCGECARRRGGEYDAETERWQKEPDVSDLPLSPPEDEPRTPPAPR